MQAIGSIWFFSSFLFMILSLKSKYLYLGGEFFFPTVYFWNLHDGYIYPKLMSIFTLPFECFTYFTMSPIIWLVNKFNISGVWFDVLHLAYISLIILCFYTNNLNKKLISNKQLIINIENYYKTGNYKGNPEDQIILCNNILDNCSYAFNKEISVTLFELVACYKDNLTIAFMSLAGRTLEIVLKQNIIIHDLQYDDRWMLWELYQFCISNNIFYNETPIEQSIETIITYRNDAIHCKDSGLIFRNQVELIFYSIMHVVYIISIQNCKRLQEENNDSMGNN